MPNVENFKELRNIAIAELKSRGLASKINYLKRLDFEFKEIDKQGANIYWIRNYNTNKKWDHNKNGLLLPFLLGMTDIDPIDIKWSYICDDEGDILSEIIIVTTDDNKKVKIPSECLIKTSRGIIKASDLNIGDELI